MTTMMILEHVKNGYLDSRARNCLLFRYVSEIKLRAEIRGKKEASPIMEVAE